MVCCLFQHFTEVTPGSVVEVRDNSIAWCYGVADPELASWQAREMQASTLASALGDLPLDIVADTRVVEVRVAVRARGVGMVRGRCMHLTRSSCWWSRCWLGLVVCCTGSKCRACSEACAALPRIRGAYALFQRPPMHSHICACLIRCCVCTSRTLWTVCSASATLGSCSTPCSSSSFPRPPQLTVLQRTTRTCPPSLASRYGVSSPPGACWCACGIRVCCAHDGCLGVHSSGRGK